MAIKETKIPNQDNTLMADKSADQQGPLLQIDLPAPVSGNPMAPLSVGQHNSAAQKNFKRVADLILRVINNQKAMGGVIVEQGKLIKTLEKNNKALAENIRKLLKKDNNDRQSKRD